MHLIIVTLLFLVSSVAHAANVVNVSQLQLGAESFVSSAPIVDLGQDRLRGVEARVRLEALTLLDISEPLDGNLQHYLISVVFIETKTGKELLVGQVAARTFTTDNQIANTVRLEPQQTQWTAILTLPSEEQTMIKIGSKLPDGKKRIYRFFYDQRPVVTLPEVVESAEEVRPAEVDTFSRGAN